MNPNSPTSSNAFTLVEVTLALGIMAFALVALLGLFNVGFQASRRSAETTTLPSLIEQIRQEEQLGNGTTPGNNRVIYFDYLGKQTSGNDFHYQCTIRATQSALSMTPGAPNRMVILHITIAFKGVEKHAQISAIR